MRVLQFRWLVAFTLGLTLVGCEPKETDRTQDSPYPDIMRERNRAVQGTWFRTTPWTSAWFTPVIRFTATSEVGGIFEDGYGTWYYGIEEFGDGVLIHDAHGDLRVTYTMVVSEQYLYLRVWNHDADFTRHPPDSCDVSVTLSALDRIPISNADGTNAGTIQVTITPSPLPEGCGVALLLSSLCSEGPCAQFENGSVAMWLTQSGTVRIRGLENSWTRDNVRLTARVAEADQAEELFSVRTYPSHVVREGWDHSDPMDALLVLNYQVHSESGEAYDMVGLRMGEWVDYAGGNDGTYAFQSPPYSREVQVSDPDIKGHLITNVTPGYAYTIMPDSHRIPSVPADGDPATGFRRPYEADAAVATQFYWYWDPVTGGDSVYIYGPSTITRTVFQGPDGWIYRIEKSEPDGVTLTDSYMLP